ncbi:hypothetical protein KKG90_11970 [Candidatus Bipolaricaulota bacterium]|nr:hypothetical protein [Candidatus Bipolaricaulota bacterium]
MLKRVASLFNCGLVVILLLLWVVWETSALPTSVFVVHCEPTRANPVMWIELTKLVAQAEARNIPLTLDFSPQWASMILADETKIALLESWIESGHEIGCHHHGYWGTKDRGSTWDGYTNTPLIQIDPEDLKRYQGTMDDYMALLTALPGERVSGCLGTSNSGDDVDYPCQLIYSTRGQALLDAVSQPTNVTLNGCDVWELSHALIASQDRGALADLYLETDDVNVFSVVGHVYNYAAFPDLFEQWFSFLASLDAMGTWRRTVSGVLGARTPSAQ